MCVVCVRVYKARVLVPPNYDVHTHIKKYIQIHNSTYTRLRLAGAIPTCTFDTWLQLGLYKILFHFEALLHNNILCKHPLYCAIYCTILPVIAPPRPIFWGVFEVFGGVWRCFFLLLRGRILDGWRCLSKKIFLDTEKGALLHIIVQYPPSSHSLLPTILRNISQSINQILKAPHEHKRSHIPAQPHE